MEKSIDRIALDIERRKAAQYLVQKYSREQRYLIVYSRDISKYIDAFTNNRFKSEEKRESLRWDFLCDFIGLKSKMNEYRWSKDFLAENGIDFRAARKLIFSLFSAEEIASTSLLV